MIRALTNLLRPARLRGSVLVLFAVLAGTSCDSTDPLATSSPSDSLPTTAAADSVATVDSLTMSSVSYVGRPFGSWGLLASGAAPGPLTLSNAAPSASSLVNTINTARSKGERLILVLTGGPHTATRPGCCLTKVNGWWTFDRTKWDKVMATFNTATIRNAVANAVADGTVIGASVMDEPYTSSNTGANTWGPPGTMTKAKVDGLCSAVQKIFPTLPAGVQHPPLAWETNKSYQICQFIAGGLYGCTGTSLSALTSCRDAALAMARRDHHQLLFNLNVINGGDRDTDGTYNCSGPNQAGLGSHYPLCRMTASRVRERGLLLGPSGCGLSMWTYNSTFWSRSDNQSAFKDVAAKMATVGPKACRRS